MNHMVASDRMIGAGLSNKRGALLLGLGMLCLLPMLTQWRQLLSAIELLGTALLPLAVLHALPILLDSRGWLALMRVLRPPRTPSWRYFWGAALIREAVANCLPLSGVGGFAVALRLMALRGVPTAQAVAGVVAESTLTLLTQMSLMLVAISAWLIAEPLIRGVRVAGVGVAATSAFLVALMFALRRDGRFLGLLERLLRRLGGLHRAYSWSGALEAVYQGLDRIYVHRRVCMKVAVWQLAAMAAAVVELWLMLTLLNLPRPLLLALSLSAVARLTRSLSVAVPAGLGVQELAFGGLLLGSGLDFNAGVAISVATRARDLMFGVPALLGWLLLERGQNRISAAPRKSPIEDVCI